MLELPNNNPTSIELKSAYKKLALKWHPGNFFHPSLSSSLPFLAIFHVVSLPLLCFCLPLQLFLPFCFLYDIHSIYCSLLFLLPSFILYIPTPPSFFIPPPFHSHYPSLPPQYLFSYLRIPPFLPLPLPFASHSPERSLSCFNSLCISPFYSEATFHRMELMGGKSDLGIFHTFTCSIFLPRYALAIEK